MVVAGGAGDNAAAACGVGVVTPGTAFVSIGTSGVLFVSNAHFSPNTEGAVHAFCHAIPDTWHQMGVILSASDSLEWLSRIAGRKPADLAAAVDPVAPSDVTFLPYLSGERTPLNDAAARGAFPASPSRTGSPTYPGGDGGRRLRLRRLPARPQGRRHRLRRRPRRRRRRPLPDLAPDHRMRPRPPARSSPPTATSAPPSAPPASRSAPPKAPRRRRSAPLPEILRTIDPDPALVSRYREGYARYRSLYPACADLAPIAERKGNPMSDFFKGIDPVPFKGPDSDDPLAFRFYEKDRLVLGKPMRDHLRMAIAYWHSFAWPGGDPFGGQTFERPWFRDGMSAAELKAEVAFEMFTILGADFFTFHDRDVAPEGRSLAESDRNVRQIADDFARRMEETGVKLLWGTANLFSNRRYMAGAATNPDPEVFAYAAAQVKSAIDVTHSLNGANYTLWGGREGYETLLNTDMKRSSTTWAASSRWLSTTSTRSASPARS